MKTQSSFLLALAAIGLLSSVLAGCSLIADPAASEVNREPATTTCVSLPESCAPAGPTEPMVPPAEAVSVGKTLHDAAKANDIEQLQALLQRGDNLESRNALGQTPLVAATKAESTEAALLLIAAGADVNATDDLEDSAFLYSGAEGLTQILAATIENGADPRSTNRYGGTALIPASEHGHREAVRMLISAGVDVDHVNDPGWTALLEAVMLSDGGPDQIEVAKQLLAAGADVNLADKNGTTPLAHAVAKGQIAMANLLRDAGGH